MAGKRRRRRASNQKESIVTPELVREIISFVLLAAGAVVAGVLVAFAFGKRVEMAGDSMSPTIANGERVLINRLSYQMSAPKRDDIIVFYGSGTRMRTYVKRVVAVGGDTVQITDGILYVNGEAMDDERFDRMEEAGIAEGAITLGTGEYFVLGDNRNNSEDSRSAGIGVVRSDMIAGKVWYTY